jgi:hypothetical protein
MAALESSGVASVCFFPQGGGILQQAMRQIL